MIINTLLPGAWSLDSDAEICLHTLRVPAPWLRAAKALAQQRYQMRGRGYSSVPVHSLDPVVIASFPNIINAEREAWQEPGRVWITAEDKIDLNDFPELVKDWLREEFDCLGDEVEKTLNHLDNDLWQWDEQPMIHPINQILEGKDIYQSLRFSVIPHFLATELTKQTAISFKVEHGSYPLRFYRVVRLNQRAELMSWPPTDIPVKNRQGEPGFEKISFVVCFALQTLPWRKEPIIYHTLGIRRWIIQPIPKLPYKGCTVYVGHQQRWLDGERQPLSFVPLWLKYKSWSVAVKNLLSQSDCKLPEIEKLRESPEWNWHRLEDTKRDVMAAITYASNAGFSSTLNPNCQSGVSPQDLASLDQAILDCLPVKRVGKAIRLNPPAYKKSDPGIETFLQLWDAKKQKKEAAIQEKEDVAQQKKKWNFNVIKEAAIRFCTAQPISILIIWETKITRDAILKQLGTYFDLEITDTPHIGLDGQIKINTFHIGELNNRLDVSKNLPQEKKRQKRKKENKKRVQEIIDYLSAMEGLFGAIVEIKNRRSYFPPESDPKLALRIGVGLQGYVNQHINPLNPKAKKTQEKFSNPVQSAIQDLFRHFGVFPAPVVHSDVDEVDDNLWLTCFHVIRRNRNTTADGKSLKICLMIRLNAYNGLVQITTSSIFSERGWLPYSEGLLTLLAEKWKPNTSNNSESIPEDDKRREQHQAQEFLIGCLKSCLNEPAKGDRAPRVLCMAAAQNARKLLPWLTNTRLADPNILGQFMHQLSEAERDRLWLVRIRDRTQDEVPVAIAEKRPGGRVSSGAVFKWLDVCDSEQHQIFLSVRDAMHSEKFKLKEAQSRLDNGSGRSAIPKPIELAILHNPGIAEEDLAVFVHTLRSRWPYFANDVALPIPFPFATKAKEYAVSPGDISESSEDEGAEE